MYRGVSRIKGTVKLPWASNSWKPLPPRPKELFSKEWQLRLQKKVPDWSCGLR